MSVCVCHFQSILPFFPLWDTHIENAIVKTFRVIFVHEIAILHHNIQFVLLDFFSMISLFSSLASSPNQNQRSTQIICSNQVHTHTHTCNRICTYSKWLEIKIESSVLYWNKLSTVIMMWWSAYWTKGKRAKEQERVWNSNSNSITLAKCEITSQFNWKYASIYVWVRFVYI